MLFRLIKQITFMVEVILIICLFQVYAWVFLSVQSLPVYATS